MKKVRKLVVVPAKIRTGHKWESWPPERTLRCNWIRTVEWSRDCACCGRLSYDMMYSGRWLTKFLPAGCVLKIEAAYSSKCYCPPTGLQHGVGNKETKIWVIASLKTSTVVLNRTLKICMSRCLNVSINDMSWILIPEVGPDCAVLHVSTSLLIFFY
jgi:hypothetical protein